MSPSEFEKYCLSIRDTGVWGGELEILALSKAYNVPIHVAQGGSPPVVVHDPAGMPNQGDTPKQRVAWISYHRRMYGLGEVSRTCSTVRTVADCCISTTILSDR